MPINQVSSLIAGRWTDLKLDKDAITGVGQLYQQRHSSIF
jgi:hypothetical protein